MKTIKEWHDEVGYTALCELIPQVQQRIVAYVGGVVVECKTEEEAKQHSKLWEKIVVNEDVIKEWKAKKTFLANLANLKWEEERKQQAQSTYGLSPSVVDKIFTTLYDKGMSVYGYESLEREFDEQCDYVAELFKLEKVNKWK